MFVHVPLFINDYSSKDNLSTTHSVDYGYRPTKHIEHIVYEIQCNYQLISCCQRKKEIEIIKK